MAWRNLLRSFYPAMRKAGIARFRFHDLRHTFATRLIQAGINVYTVQKLGRWKMISMVLRYAHHQPEEFARGCGGARSSAARKYHICSTEGIGSSGGSH